MAKRKQKDWKDLGLIGFVSFVLIATWFSLSRFNLDVAIDTIATGFLYTLGAIVLTAVLWFSGLLEAILNRKRRGRR